jgi:hypothetical protein
MSFVGARVAVKTSNGEFLSYGGDGALQCVSSCDDSRQDIIFNVPMAVTGTFIQTHTRDLVSVGDTGELGVKLNKEAISNTELFDFICLGMNRVAIRAHNGKFLSFKENENKTLSASSDTIGPNETFEVIVVFR